MFLNDKEGIGCGSWVSNCCTLLLIAFFFLLAFRINAERVQSKPLIAPLPTGHSNTSVG